MGDRAAGDRADAKRRRRVPPDVRYARHCYSHLAGQLGVALADALASHGFVEARGESVQLTSSGAAWMLGFGLDLNRRRSATPMIRNCLDWTERRPHFAGVAPTLLLQYLIAQDCLRRTPNSRVLQPIPAGQAWFAQLGIPVDPVP